MARYLRMTHISNEVKKFSSFERGKMSQTRYTNVRDSCSGVGTFQAFGGKEFVKHAHDEAKHGVDSRTFIE
jgi:hypothetical protein